MKKTKSARRRWFVVGPGLLLAGLAAVLVVWTGHMGTGEPTRRDRVSPAPAGSTIPHLAPAPDPAFLLQEAPALQLTAVQTERLGQLVKRYQKETGEVQTALDQASGDFARQMGEEGRKTMRLSKLQPVRQRTENHEDTKNRKDTKKRERGKSGSPFPLLLFVFFVSFVSSWLAFVGARGEVSGVLTPEQRTEAETLWVQKLVPKGRP